MNITPLTIYLWQLADSIRDASTLFSHAGAVILGIIMFVGTMAYCIEEEARLVASKILKWGGLLGGPVLILSMLVTCFTPTSKTVAMMVVIPAIAESKVIQEDLPDIYNAAVEALKGAIKPDGK